MSLRFENMVGVTFKSVTQMSIGEDEIHFEAEDGRQFKMYHRQDCCESVYVEDIVGDLDDLVGHPITLAEESSNQSDDGQSGDYSHTWTFYRLSTNKGSVTIRWYGSSNGYYSESVDFVQLD